MRLHLTMTKSSDRLPEVGSRFLGSFQFSGHGALTVVEYERINDDLFEGVANGTLYSKEVFRRLYPYWLEILDTDTGEIVKPTADLFYSIGGIVAKTKTGEAIEGADKDAD